MLEDTEHNHGSEAALYRLLQGFKITQALYVTAKLNVFDILRDGPKTAGEIAAAAGAHESALGRVLRFLTMLDILTEDEQGRFAATDMGERLRSDHPRSERPEALFCGSPFFWRPWGELYQTVVTGEPGFDRVYGESCFTHLSHDVEDAATFNAAMTRGTTGMLEPMLTAYDFSGFGKIVDVAGGHGAMLRGILERYPAARGVLYETAAVVAEARELRGSPVETRCEFLAGDMFQSVPAGGDAYLMKYIIHDWNDEAAIRILKNCRQAINRHGKLIVVESIVLPSNQPDPAKWDDLDMLVMVSGRERTADDYGQLYSAAGFELTRVVPAGDFSLIEGTPV